jgi:predicted RNA-binding protein
MCDVKVYVSRQGKEELLLEAVNHLRVEQGEVTVRNLFGEEKKVRGEVREVSLVKNRVVVDQE